MVEMKFVHACLPIPAVRDSIDAFSVFAYARSTKIIFIKVHYSLEIKLDTKIGISLSCTKFMEYI